MRLSEDLNSHSRRRFTTTDQITNNKSSTNYRLVYILIAMSRTDVM